jgi:dipeptidyl aminopeptidase/acylaminoacyl peptidase
VTRAFRSVAPVAVAVIAAATCVPALSAPRAFGYDDVFRLVSLSTPQLSPDGTRILTVVSRLDREHDKRVRTIESIDARSGARRAIELARSGVADPRWSPSGDRIAFVADAPIKRGSKETKPQVWVVPANGGTARRVTNAPEGVEQFAWRPDGTAIAYAAIDPEPKKSGDARYVDAYAVGNDPALAHGAARPARVWLQRLAGGRARLLTPGAGSATQGEAQSSLSFSPDGATLAYAHAPTAVLNDADEATIRLIDVASGRERPLGASASHEYDPHFSGTGAHLAYAHSEGDNQVHPVEAYVTEARGGPGRSVSHPIDRAVRDVGWEPDADVLDVTVADGTHDVLERIPFGGTPQRVDLGGVSIVSGLDGALGRGGTIAFVGSTTTHSDEIYLAAPGTAPRRLTNYNDATASLALGTSERITFPTTAGVDGDAVLVKPPGYAEGRTYPLAIVIHGGPTSTSTETFSTRVQLMAAHGWLVLLPNYRGSPNLGERYQRAIFMDTVEGPGRDVRAALDAVKARGIVDASRIAVSGWSYGGVMTTWMITHYHDWRVAVAGAPVTDIVADYATADDINADRELFRGSPWVGNNRADYLAQSPITYVADVTTPVLLMTDRGDQRVSPVSAYEFYHALRDLGKPVDLVAYPVDGHFPSDPVRSADVNRRWVEYIAERMK